MIVNKPKKKKELSRFWILLIIMAIVFTIITAKLIYLQIYKNADYKDKANVTSTKFISEKAPRGEILDQNGNILATNIQNYALTYTTTEEANKAFFNTMDAIFTILNENNEVLQDDLKLKLDGNNEWYISYTNTDLELIKAEDIRFKRDRGLNEAIEKDLEFTNEDGGDLTDPQIAQVNEKLVEISPEEVFYSLVKSYNLINLIDSEPSDDQKKVYDEMTGKEIADMILEKGYTYQQLRNYMVVKDALKMQSFKGYKSVTITKNIHKETAFIILQKLNDLPGIDVSLEPTRNYPYNTLASSVLGYLSPIDTSNKENYELKGYDASTDLIGVAGIESAFEEQLKGVTGGTTVKVNSKGRVTEELFKLESYPGNNVHLTIDKNIQDVAEKALADNMKGLQDGTVGGEVHPNATRGACIAVEAKTGRILALVSLPNYNPNLFSISGKLTDEQNKEYFSPDLEKFGQNYINSRGLNGIKTIDDLFPKDSNGNRQDMYDLYPRSFYNYATQGLIPPGSTFKPMTGIVGLESNVVGTAETIADLGKFNKYPEVYGSSFGPECLEYTVGGYTHGNVNIEKALEVSCNYYFYEVAHRIYMNGGANVGALDSIAKYAWKFGLGTDPAGQQKASTGIEITENFGQVYNFQSFKNRMSASAKFALRDGLEAGNLRGESFVPFDYSDLDDDTESLKAAKKSLKDKISARLQQVGIDSSALKSDPYAATLVDDIKNIMNNSSKYKSSVQEYEARTNKTVDLDKQASTISIAISQYIIFDIGTQITSPAQEVIAAIGQGMNTFTPMQLAQYISTIVNNGTRNKLHLVDKITNPQGQVVQEFGTEVLDKIDLKPSTIAAIKNGMKKVNTGEEGTAASTFANFPIETGGKTGTADFKEDQKSFGRSPYATYVTFAPFDDPEIVFVGVVYDGGHGGYIAPTAKAIFEQYFKDRITQVKPDYTFTKYISEVQPDNKEQ
jgi:penicillin-binding protein 2